MKKRNVVIVGAEEVGKTTLVNALLGRDILPQTANGYVFPTRECVCLRLTETVYLTDTPGYSLFWGKIPEETVDAVARADTVVVMLSEELAEECCPIPALDPDWEERRAKEAALVTRLLKYQKNRDVYFVIPFDTTDRDEDAVPLSHGLRLARQRFAALSDHGEEGFFCVDPMLALIGALEMDQQELEDSGIAPLRAAVTGGLKTGGTV